MPLPYPVYTADDIMMTGLLCMNISREIQATRSYSQNEDWFKKHYGLAPHVVAVMWEDICTTDIEEVKLGDKEKGETGLKRFLMAFFFLWTYPKNRHLLASRFCVSDKETYGKKFWKWVSRIAALSAKVIVWPDEFSDLGGAKFIISVDCRDHKISEKKHPRYNVDQSFASKKHGKHAALKYELALSVWSDKIVWINGPFKATNHDITIFRKYGLKEKMIDTAHGKFAIADLGYWSNIEEYPDETMLAYPNSKDPLSLKKFKSLCRCREEDVNGRMSKFMCLSREFTHTIDHQHVHAWPS